MSSRTNSFLYGPTSYCFNNFTTCASSGYFISKHPSTQDYGLSLLTGLFHSTQNWLDRNIYDLANQMRMSYLPPMMVYLAAGVSRYWHRRYIFREILSWPVCRISGNTGLLGDDAMDAENADQPSGGLALAT